MAQVERLAEAAGPVDEDADLPVDHLEAVAHGAVAQGAGLQRLGDVRQLRLDVAGAGRQHDHTRRRLAAFPGRLEDVADRAQAVDPAGGRLDAVAARLPAQRGGQVGAGDAVGEAGVVVRARDAHGAAVPGVDEDHRAAEARQVDGRDQAGRTGADDEDIKGLGLLAHEAGLRRRGNSRSKPCAPRLGRTGTFVAGRRLRTITARRLP
jgi:hypothetical protein